MAAALESKPRPHSGCGGAELVPVATEPCEDVGHRRLRVPFGFRLVGLSMACFKQPLITARATSPEPISPSLSER